MLSPSTAFHHPHRSFSLVLFCCLSHFSNSFISTATRRTLRSIPRCLLRLAV
jgi:hypothetical protein